jgi:hypothetical protein
MIKNNTDLSYIDLHNNALLYNNLLCLTVLCMDCHNNTCTGGYNCKNGSCDSKLVICKLDLNSGNCSGSCGKIHLTSKNMKPYNYKPSVPKYILLNDTYFGNDNIVDDTADNIVDDSSDMYIFKNTIKTPETVNITLKSIFKINVDNI